jgi:UPF0042 nucleotide-binding protein
MKNRPIVFVTGLSGAGISNALKALEDCGYEVFDNFPLAHVESLLSEKNYEDGAIAFGFDSRTRGYNPERIILMAQESKANLLFLSATNATLQQRFSETRRVHPLAKDRTVTDGIIFEREWLSPLKSAANLTLDTTDLSVHEFRRMIESSYAQNIGKSRLLVTVMSFGFKNGTPREVDMMLDVRFLQNPYWVSNLKLLTGQDLSVQEYITKDNHFNEFYKKSEDLIDFLLPNYTAEGKSYFTLGFGCTGGKHRSVFLAEKMATRIEKMGYPTTIRHRDL